jgi:hypothetical protein
MDSPLQKPAQSLLAAFDLKVLGQNPTLFSDTVSPTVDVYDQYLANQLQVVTGTDDLAIGTRDAEVLLTVPIGYAYRINAVSIAIDVATADVAFTFNGYVAVRQTAGSVQTYLLNGAMDLAGTLGGGFSLFRVNTTGLVRPFWLFPGWQLVGGVVSSANATAISTMRCSALVQVISDNP